MKRLVFLAVVAVVAAGSVATVAFGGLDYGPLSQETGGWWAKSGLVGYPVPTMTLTIDPTGAFSAKNGTAAISGTITCPLPAPAQVFGQARQTAGRAIITGFFVANVNCDASSRWAAVVQSENGRFAGGRLEVTADAIAFIGSDFLSASASQVVHLRGGRTTVACPRGGNDGFEAGVPDSNSIPCWTEVDQSGSYGSWCTQTGTTPPQGACSGDAPPVPPPPEGQQAAMTNEGGPSSMILYRCGTLRTGQLSFQLFINNEAGTFASPPTLDFFNGSNQQFRADLVSAAAMTANPFTVAPGDVLLNLYQTQPGDAAVSGYSTVMGDASQFVRQDVCLRFAVADNLFFFHAGVDDVSIDLASRGPR